MNSPIETIRIGMVASSLERLDAIKDGIRSEEAAGWLRILRMDDEVAVVQYLDPKRIMLFCAPAGAA